MELRQFLLPVCVLACAAGALAAQQPAAPRDSAWRVDSIFLRLNSRQTPGCAVSVARDGRPILTRAYGMADLEHDVPNTAATIFEAGSVSKQFTAAAVVLLAQQGRLSLDDEVRRYIPELPDYGAPITLREMLNHTSGFRDWGAVAAISGWPRGSRVHTNEHALDITRRQRAVNFPPGSEYLYSNTNFNLLAIVVQRVSGIPFAEFTRRNLFEPIGMASTQWRDDYTRIVPGRAIAYNRAADGFHSDMPFENVHGNGGLLTTVGDLLLWNQNLTTGRVGGRGFTEELQRRGRLTSGRTIQYAEGLFVRTYRDVPEVAHDGATAGYRAFLARYPDQRLSVALLCNLGSVDPTAVGHAVADVFLPPARQPAPTVARVGLAPQELESRAGLYRNTRTNELMRLSVQGGALRSAAGPELVPIGANEFRMGDGPARVFFDGGGTAGGRAVARLVTPAPDTVLYEPVEPQAPLSAAQLAEFAGDYYSPDAEATYTITADDQGRLVARSGVTVHLTLTPAYRDAFSSGRTIVIFSRDGGGRVTGFGVWVDRVRGLRFDRVGRPQ